MSNEFRSLFASATAHVYVAEYVSGDGWWLDDDGRDWWSRRDHFRYNALYLTKVGAFDLKIGSKWYHVLPHSLVYIPAGSDLEFRFDGKGPLEKYFVHFDISFGAARLAECFAMPSLVMPQNEARIEEIFEGLVRSTAERDDPVSEIAVRGLLFSLVAEALRAGDAEFLGTGEAIDREMRETAAYIERHYGEPLPVSMLAERVGYSMTYFTKKFKKAFGCTPTDYIAELRLRYAKHWLLRGEMSVSEIAAALGFCDASYFSSFFKSKTGLSPVFYRKNSRDGRHEEEQNEICSSENSGCCDGSPSRSVILYAKHKVF